MELKIGERYILQDEEESFFVTLLSHDPTMAQIRRIRDNCDGVCKTSRLRPYFKIGDKCSFIMTDGQEVKDVIVRGVSYDSILDLSGNGWAGVDLSYVKRVIFLEDSPPQECVCDRLDLFNLGCKCGQMERERAARLDKRS